MLVWKENICMTVTISLAEDLEQQLRDEAQRLGLSLEAYSAKILTQHVEAAGKNRTAAERLESLFDGDEEEQKQTGEELLRSLDEHRLSSRPLFPPELENITW
jgi:hypothetical protein